MATANNSDIVQQILSHLQDLKKTDYGTTGALGGAIGAYVNGNKVADAYGASASDAESQANTLRSQMDNMPTLADMYGPNSSYATQMAQTLARKDAASGRNSQYGPRAVQLQAMLADKGSQYAQQQAAMAQAYNTARSNANTQRVNATTGQAQVQGQQLGSLFNLGEKSGLLPALNQGISNMAQPYIDKMKTGLGDMFPSWNGPSNAGSNVNTPQQSFMDRQGSDIPWDNNSSYDGSFNPSASSGSMGSGVYQPQTDYAPQPYQNNGAGTNFLDEYQL
jgi:hypothetical protein